MTVPSMVPPEMADDWKVIVGAHEIQEGDQCVARTTYHMVPRLTTEMGTDPATIDLLAMLINFLEPETVVEAGTYFGHFAMTAAVILQALGRGTVYTADVTDHSKEFRLSERYGALWQTRITFWHGDYAKMIPQIPGSIDFAFIDASAVAEPGMRRRHFEATWPRMAPGGIIAIHDTANEWSDAAWFRSQHGLHLRQQRGLTLIQKP